MQIFHCLNIMLHLEGYVIILYTVKSSALRRKGQPLSGLRERLLALLLPAQLTPNFCSLPLWVPRLCLYML